MNPEQVQAFYEDDPALFHDYLDGIIAIQHAQTEGR